MSAPDVGVDLIGDIGATNARFALVLPGGKTVQPRVCALDDYSSLTDAIDAYLIEQSPVARPIEAVLGDRLARHRRRKSRHQSRVDIFHRGTAPALSA